MVQVLVNSNDLARVDRAFKVVKRKVQREGIPRELRNRKHFEKPSDKIRRKRKDSTRRKNKLRRRFDY